LNPRFSQALLPAAILLQAILLVPNLGLLPVWSDEQSTLSTTAEDIPDLLRIVRADIHPPLYFLLSHYWVQLPLPGSPIERVRLLSVLFALLATFAIDRAWAHKLRPAARAWFYSLWVLSPFLLLYARMGRSYSLQLLLSFLALRYGCEAIRHPSRLQSKILYVLWATLLLYTHYLPGLAVPAAVAVAGFWKCRHNRRALFSIAVVHAAIAALYAPWLGSLGAAALRVPAYGNYRITSHELLEHGVRLAYTFVTATFGESLPVWSYVLAAMVSPVVFWLLARGARQRPEWLWVVIVAAVVGYCGAATGVIFSLIPARLLFLLPFYLLLLVLGRERTAVGTACLVLLLCLSGSAIASYYRGRNFLNKGYVLPLDRIAGEAAAELTEAGGVLIVDGSNTDPAPLLAALPRSIDRVVSIDARSLPRVRTSVSGASITRVWFLRNTHDVTQEAVNTQIERELSKRFRRGEQRFYVRYTAIDRVAMTVLRWPTKPDYVLELLKYERRL
jgi:hypothetical protein